MTTERSASTVKESTSGAARTFNGFSEITSFLWSVADLLRGDYKQADYGKVILPLTVIRRLDCVLDKTKAKVLAKHVELKQAKHPEGTIEKMLLRASGNTFYNTSKLDFEKLKGDPNNIAANLTSYIKGFSPTARDVIDQFKFAEQIAKLDEGNLLFQVVSRFAEVDLHPDKVPNHVMGSIFEELIRKFAEASNETAGEHFTPREVIRLMVDLLFIEDEETLTKKGIVRTLYDPAAGTGGMLSVAEEYLRELNADAELKVYGQELNSESYAICKSDMMIKGQDPEHIVRGNSFTEDGHVGKKFDYMLSNPPFGVEWTKIEAAIRNEHETQGHSGRFGAGLPPIDDGSLLFLQHMLSKMKPPSSKTGDAGARLAIIFNGSPLASGRAGSDESEIRRWIIESDWLECVIALSGELFYNTGIHTFLWILTNRKSARRKGKIQLINAVALSRARKPLGHKRNELAPEHIAAIVQEFGEFRASDISKIFDNDDFGYRRLVVEQPLRLAFRITEERIKALLDVSPFRNLATTKKKGAAGKAESEKGGEVQIRIQRALREMMPNVVVKDRAEFERMLSLAFEERALAIPKPVIKAIALAFSERDGTAEVCTDSKGRQEPDPDLRDVEQVPLKEDIHRYFVREVVPYAPGAWLDETKIKVGYDIPINKSFYQYPAVRAVPNLNADLQALRAEVEQALASFAAISSTLLSGLDVSAPTRESEIPWVGEIPAHWKVKRFKYVGQESKGRRGDLRGAVLLSVSSIHGVIERIVEGATVSGDADDYGKYLLVRPGQLVLNVMWMAQRGLGVATIEGITSPDYRVYDLGSEIYPRYAHHLLRHDSYLSEYRRLAYSVRPNSQRVGRDDFAALPIVIPPLDEQKAVADALDAAASRADLAIRQITGSLIALQEALASCAIFGGRGVVEGRV